MKRLVQIFAVVIVFSQLAFAQKKGKTKVFKGIVTYTITYNGDWDPSVLAQQPKSTQIKILGKRSMTEIVSPGVTIKNISNGYDSVQYLLIDAGSMGKFYIKTTKEKFIEKLKEAQPKINYLDETKQIAGYIAKKAEFITKDEYGDEQKIIVYYNEEIAGPEYNFLNNFPTLKGFPMEYTMPLEEGKSITFSVSEVKTSKVKIKETDFMIPTDFKETTEEELKNMFGGGE